MGTDCGSEERELVITDLPSVLLTEVLSRLPQALLLDTQPSPWRCQLDHSRRHAAAACRALREAAQGLEQQLSVELPQGEAGAGAAAFLARLAAWTRARRASLLDLRLPSGGGLPSGELLDLSPLAHTPALRTLLMGGGRLKVEGLRGLTQLTHLALAPELDHGQTVDDLCARAGRLLAVAGSLTRLARLALPDLVTGLAWPENPDHKELALSFASYHLSSELALLPVSLSALVQLTRLDVSSLAATASLLSSLPQLQHLSLRREQFDNSSGLDAGTLQPCQALTCLEVSGVRLRTGFPVLPSLVVVHLNNCRSTCSLDLARFERVKRLSVLVTASLQTYEGLVNLDYTRLRSLTQLESLTIEGASQPGRLADELGALTGLSELRLGYRGRPPLQVPLVCSQLPALRFISLEGSHRTGAWWEPLLRPPAWWRGCACWEGREDMEAGGWTSGFLSHTGYNGVTTFTRRG